MLQVFCFHESDVQEAYRKLNVFLAELAAVGVEVPLEHVQANTKTYPDYGTTATTINVALEIETSAAYEVMPGVLDAPRRALESREEVSASDVAVYPLEHAPTSGISDFDPFLDTDEALP